MTSLEGFALFFYKYNYKEIESNEMNEAHWDPVTKTIGNTNRTGTEIQFMAQTAASKGPKKRTPGQRRGSSKFTPSSPKEAKANIRSWNAYWERAREGYKTEEYVMERELSSEETYEKEEIVKELKKSASDFKERYGERWKDVLYATATENAKRNRN